MESESGMNRFFLFTGFGRSLVLFLLSIFCLNIAIISIAGSYDIRVGFVHLTARGLFKPVLMMNGCFIIALMICSAGRKIRDSIPGSVDGLFTSSRFYRTLLLSTIILLVLVIYVPSAGVNLRHNEWTQKHISAGIASISSTWQFFTHGDPTGFYRPLGFISLWADYRLFGDADSGYHVQSIGLHLINSLLVAWLASALGFGRKCAFWSGSLFAAAAVNFEAVVWPAARFDLLSTMFTLLALVSVIRYLHDTRLYAWTLPASILFYVCGVMNKESSYCFCLLLVFILCTREIWNIPPQPVSKLILCLSSIAAATAILLCIRIAVYGNLGGYPTAEGVPSYHFRVDSRTFLSLVRALPIPLLGINTSSEARAWGHGVPLMFAVPVLFTAYSCRGCFRRKEYALIAMTVLSLAPVLNIVGWIGSWMQHSRYLYMPAIFVMLLIASTAVKIRWSAAILGAFLFVNASGAASNIRVYLDMMKKAATFADTVRSDWMRRSSPTEICLIGLPEHTDGVFYFGTEVVEQIGSRIPNAKIVRQEVYDPESSDTTGKLFYRWSRDDRSLYPVGQR